MDLASIIIIGIVLLGGLLGFALGFFKILLKALHGITSFIISFFLAKPVGTLIYHSSIGSKISVQIEQGLLTQNEIFQQVLTNDNQAEVISKGLSSINIPSFMHDLINSLMGNIVTDSGGNTLAHYSGIALSKMACVMIAFVILVLISLIIIQILKMIFKSLLNAGVISLLNRIIGAVTGVLFAVVIIAGLLYGIAILSSISVSFREWSTQFLKLEEETMTLAKWLYEKNLLNKIYHIFF